MDGGVGEPQVVRWWREEPDGVAEAPARRSTNQQFALGRDAAAEETRAAGLLQRPALVECLCHRGDSPGAQRGRAVSPASVAVGRAVRGRAAGDRRPVLPPDLPRIPQRRRRLRRQQGESGTRSIARGSERAPGRLRADRRGVGGGRNRQHRLRSSGPGSARRGDGHRDGGRPGADEPARHQGVRHGVRDPDLRLRVVRAGHDRPRVCRDVDRRPTDSRIRGHRDRARERLSPVCSWSRCCCARSRPDVRL